jgi:nickel/cobalt exporter
MTAEITTLCVTAASIGFFHTLLGPDHYLPFIVMSKAGNWSMPKTALVTFLCGFGHVLSSLVLGLLGVAFGVAVGNLEIIEGVRGNVAAWMLMGFGLAYAVWGIRAALSRPHTHAHAHTDGQHMHAHTHANKHVHLHEGGRRHMTPWVLFTIFVFGPCEPLIPILMYPAAKQSVSGMILVSCVFAATTILTMFAVVLVSAWGVSFARLGHLERYSHALAGAAILLSGLAIQCLGL